MLWWPPYWTKGHQILVQFLFHSDNGYSKCFEPKGCPKKNLKYVFWSRGQKSKFQIWSNCAEILHGLVGYQYKLFVFSGPYWFRSLFKKYSHFNFFKMAYCKDFYSKLFIYAYHYTVFHITSKSNNPHTIHIMEEH